MPMYAGIGGAVTEIPAWYAGVNGAVHQITKFPVGINGTVYTINLGGGFTLTVIAKNDRSSPVAGEDPEYYSSITVQNTQYRVDTMQPSPGQSSIEIPVEKNEQFQIVLHSTLSDGPDDDNNVYLYVNGETVYEGIPKEATDQVYIYAINGNVTVELRIYGRYTEGQPSFTGTQSVTITGDVTLISAPA